MFTTLGCKDIGMRKSEFVTMSQFLCKCSYFIILHVKKTNFIDPKICKQACPNQMPLNVLYDMIKNA